MRRAPEVMTAGEAEVETIGKKVRIGRAMIEELHAHDVLADVRELGRDVFVVHSRADDVAAPESAEELFAAARPLKSLMLFDGADHLLLKREGDARLVGKALAAWAQPR
jgi:putative redox protein